ncbi:unnamed protein product, partial [Amoebophrya sp. A25]
AKFQPKLPPANVKRQEDSDFLLYKVQLVEYGSAQYGSPRRVTDTLTLRVDVGMPRLFRKSNVGTSRLLVQTKLRGGEGGAVVC